MHRDRPRSGVRLWIVNSQLDLEVPVVWSADPLSKSSAFADRAATRVEPYVAAQTDRVDDQCVALPFRRRVTVPGGGRIDRQRTSIREDLAVARTELVENCNKAARLNDLLPMRKRPDAG